MATTSELLAAAREQMARLLAVDIASASRGEQSAAMRSIRELQDVIDRLDRDVRNDSRGATVLPIRRVAV